MIKQLINIENYWKIIVYYNVNYNLFNYIANDLYNIGASNKTINNIYKTMATHKAKAFTLSNKREKISVVAFNRHNSRYDYINSIIHEAEHIKQAMLSAYNVVDENEPPAYTIGYVAMKMLRINKMLKLL